jgi:hypothetical protein
LGRHRWKMKDAEWTVCYVKHRPIVRLTENEGAAEAFFSLVLLLEVNWADSLARERPAGVQCTAEHVTGL